MAWTTPSTWVAGAVVTAAQLNTQLRDNMKALGDPWIAYTPTLTASTTNPTLGTGSTASGFYIAAGKLIIGKAKIVFGSSGAVAGSGQYRLSLPVTAVNTTLNKINQTTFMSDSSAGANAQPTAYLAATTYLQFAYSATWPSGTTTIVTDALPWVWAASDSIEVAFVYEAA